MRWNVRDSESAVLGASDFRVEEAQPRDGTVLFIVHGDIDLHSADELGDLLVSAVDRGALSLVVDLADVGFVDSQGLGALLRGTRPARSGGGALPARGSRAGDPARVRDHGARPRLSARRDARAGARRRDRR